MIKNFKIKLINLRLASDIELVMWPVIVNRFPIAAALNRDRQADGSTPRQATFLQHQSDARIIATRQLLTKTRKQKRTYDQMTTTGCDVVTTHKRSSLWFALISCAMKA